MTRYHVETNAVTGEVTTRPYTAEEEAAAEAALVVLPALRDLPAEIDALAEKLARTEAALVEKAILTKAELDVPATLHQTK